MPTQVAKELFDTKAKMRLKKVVSGSNHTLALTECGKIFSKGDGQFGKLGRVLSIRKQEWCSLNFEKIGVKNAEDIFCGGDASFYINEKKHVFSWGHNDDGQLGIGNKFNQSAPKRIKELDPFEGDYVVEIGGGDFHSIARTLWGAVYTWGRNDEGNLGIGDTFGIFDRQRKADAAAAEAERLQKEEEEKKNEVN